MDKIEEPVKSILDALKAKSTALESTIATIDPTIGQIDLATHLIQTQRIIVQLAIKGSI